MTTFIIGILSFLLAIFPSCGLLLAPYQSLTFPGEEVITEEIMNAIDSKDIAALEAMMSSKLKQSVKDLRGEIGAITAAIDGKIVDYSWNGATIYDEANFGKRISRRTWEIKFDTAAKSYSLYISWVIVDNRTPDEVGMYSMILLDPELSGTDNSVLAKVPASS